MIMNYELALVYQDVPIRSDVSLIRAVTIRRARAIDGWRCTGSKFTCARGKSIPLSRSNDRCVRDANPDQGSRAPGNAGRGHRPGNHLSLIVNNPVYDRLQWRRARLRPPTGTPRRHLSAVWSHVTNAGYGIVFGAVRLRGPRNRRRPLKYQITRLRMLADE
ncbi:hypothetical protein EVAR_7234_1 [Eumeta japonica]|uniref:Uncharacterized protein n=1 Tax=Eumeta variegata TaxID=151549 RepID=A0A4C1T592_EUMVA|nr:hypothetical protein EVAR_7234_1 [Eumeta japonica]